MALCTSPHANHSETAMQNQPAQTQNFTQKPAQQGPFEIDAQLLHQISGGLPKSGWTPASASTDPLPKSGW